MFEWKLWEVQTIQHSMDKVHLICILAGLLAIAAGQASPAVVQLEGLQVGSLAFTNLNQSQTQLFVHNFDQQFQSKPQLALGVVGVEETGLLLDTSFHVMPQSVTQTGMALSWSRNLQKWVRIAVKYIASGRSDLLLGYRQIVTTQSGNASTAVTLSTDAIANYDTSILRTFLLGCDSSSNRVECGVLPKSVGNCSITVEVYAGRMEKATVSFSFVVFSPSAAAFTSYGGYLTNQSFQGGYSTSLHKSIAFTPYRFYALSYLNYSTSQHLTIAAFIDDQLVFQIGSDTLIDRYALFHIIMGRPSKSACPSSCQYLSQCLPSCPSDTFVFNYTDGGKSCKTCPAVLNLTLLNGACVPSNTTNLTSIQDLFQQPANPTNQASQSSPNAQLTASATSPPPSLSPPASPSSPSSTASSLQQSQPLTQNAVSTYYEMATAPPSTSYETQPSTDYSASVSSEQGGTQASQYYATSTQSGSSSCPQNQFLINGKCVCQVGLALINGYCSPINTSDPDLVPLSYDSIPSAAIDQTNYQPQVYAQQPTVFQESSGQRTVPQLSIDCGQGFDNGLGVCVCSAGLQFSQGRCIYVAPPTTSSYSPQCGANMFFHQSSQQCRCLPRYTMRNGQCIGDSRENETQKNDSQVNDDSNKTLSSDNQTNQTNNQICGNGIVEGNQQCDDQNIKDGDGCSSSCTVQKGYICQNSPSLCKPAAPNTTANSTTPTPTPTPPSNSSIQNSTKQNQTSNSTSSSVNLQLWGDIKANNNQIFLTMDAITEFTFEDQESMKNFLKAKFVGCPSPTIFCSQQASKKNLFDCLLLFPSGIPNKPFTANFAYSYQSKSGSCSVPIDPLKCQLSQTLARTNSKSTTLSRVT